MRLSEFDFDLPEERIALHPARPRDSARLLVVRPGGEPEFSDHSVAALADQLDPGDCLVFNDTRVIPARLCGERVRGGNRVAIEALLVERKAPSAWSALAKPGKRLQPGDRLHFGAAGRLAGEVVAKADDGSVLIGFDLSGPALDAAIAGNGAMPLPPYILDARQRRGDLEPSVDHTDYQTMFAAQDGAIAAPTAALHFTPGLISRLSASGIDHAFVTLHVGAGTFLPIKDENLEAHRMHAERGAISVETADRLNTIRAHGGRIVAVGTTVCRLLETAADPAGRIKPFAGTTEIFIRPGYRFRAVDALVTNFHLPKSTLLLLVSAFSGVERMRKAYAHAIAGNYRFYSYGDASVLFPQAPGPAT